MPRIRELRVAAPATALLLAFGSPVRIDAQGTDAATYQVTFVGNWNTSSTPDGVVGGAHFTTLIGAVHNGNVTFWAPGGTATAGVEAVAELGATSTFKSEYSAIPAANRKALIEESGTGATGTSTFTIEATQSHPLVTLLSMIGPSPDWFVGVSGLSLRDSQGWQSRISTNLFPYDAGTEDGTEFSLSNPATSPQGTITSIKGTGKFSNSPMATLTFVLQTSQPDPGPPPGPGPQPDPEPDPEPEPPPPPPPPTVSVSDAQAPESARAVVFDVRLSRTSSSVVTVDYATSDGAGGAKAGADYTATAGTLTFASGSRAERIRIPVTDDGRYEAAPETFTLTLRRPVNATLAGGRSELRVTGTIHDDDDGPPMAAFEVMDATCDEELCRASTDAPVRFVDTSRGRVLSSRWDFGDGTTSASVRPAHSWSEPGFYEVSLSVDDGETVSTASRRFLVEAAAPSGTCAADDETRCLGDSRFAVTVDWRAGDGGSGPGRVVPEGTNDSALFRFFDEDNWEVLIKVLDGCSVNGHVWVYGASATTLGYTIRVTDTVTGAVKEYRNETRRSADAIVDAAAFPDVCREG